MYSVHDILLSAILLGGRCTCAVFYLHEYYIMCTYKFTLELPFLYISVGI